MFLICKNNVKLKKLEVNLIYAKIKPNTMF